MQKLGWFYLKEQRWEEAVACLETLREEYPEHRLVPESIYKLAGAYEEMGETALAIDVYEEFAERYPDDEMAESALDEAAALRRAD